MQTKQYEGYLTDVQNFSILFPAGRQQALSGLVVQLAAVDTQVIAPKTVIAEYRPVLEKPLLRLHIGQWVTFKGQLNWGWRIDSSKAYDQAQNLILQLAERVTTQQSNWLTARFKVILGLNLQRFQFRALNQALQRGLLSLPAYQARGLALIRLCRLPQLALEFQPVQANQLRLLKQTYSRIAYLMASVEIIEQVSSLKSQPGDLGARKFEPSLPLADPAFSLPPVLQPLAAEHAAKQAMNVPLIDLNTLPPLLAAQPLVWRQQLMGLIGA